MREMHGRPRISRHLYIRLVGDLIRDRWSVDVNRSYSHSVNLQADKPVTHPRYVAISITVSLFSDAISGVTLCAYEKGEEKEPLIYSMPHSDLPEVLDEAWVLSHFSSHPIDLSALDNPPTGLTNS